MLNKSWHKAIYKSLYFHFVFNGYLNHSFDCKQDWMISYTHNGEGCLK